MRFLVDILLRVAILSLKVSHCETEVKIPLFHDTSHLTQSKNKDQFHVMLINPK